MSDVAHGLADGPLVFVQAAMDKNKQVLGRVPRMPVVESRDDLIDMFIGKLVVFDNPSDTVFEFSARTLGTKLLPFIETELFDRIFIIAPLGS